ncbi:MAG: proprotein convertase P-domain-containing protein [Pirellulales bacterium]
MARRKLRKMGWNSRGASASRGESKRLRGQSRTQARFGIEHLEQRNLLAVDPFGMSAAIANDLTIYTSPVFHEETEVIGSASAVLIPAPFDLSETFMLHSRPSATKTIYLDFDGHITRDTQWNIDFEVPNIVTPAYNVDPDTSPAFSDNELERIQYIWERVSEDFRPFNVNVTTEEPPLEDLMREGPSDTRWGQRVAIGGTNADWLFDPGVGGIAYGSFNWNSDTPTYVFNPGEKGTAETISHEVGHTLGIGHDGQIVPPTEAEPEPDPLEYYGGHGTGPTAWGPIMGAAFSPNLTQWSQGEYWLATNTQDDLAIITAFNGFDYRPDDHGSTRVNASLLGTTSTTFFGDGLIERNTDVDYFQFTVGGQGEAVSFDITPFHRGPNLDILAKLYNSTGTVLASSNPVDDLNAELGANLAAGTYYVSIEGTGRPQASATDYGFTKYGSLGYFSIVGTRKELLVGVDFDLPGGAVPTNWTRYTGTPTPAVLSDLKNEANFTTPFNLAISTAGSPITRTANTINTGSLPDHTQPLTNLGGYASSTAWNFTWSDLAPSTAYEVFVFGLGGAAGANDVQIIGAETTSFTQSLTTNDLYINGAVGATGLDLGDFGLTVTSTALGTIEITVTPQSGTASLGGLGIRPAKLGSIEGQKWNDLNGDTVKDSDEPGLEGWTIFLDANGNDVWDNHTQHTVASIDIPQDIENYTTVKSELLFQGISSIEDVDVALDISHTFVADLVVTLISPSGIEVELFSHVGGQPAGHLDNFHGTILDDEATTAITAGTAPYTGRFRPEQSLSILDGEDPNGIWTLEISDTAGVDIGVLNSWSITVTGSELFTVTDESGNYSFENLAPGIYDVREVLDPESEWVQTVAPVPVTITSGARVTDIDFANWIPIFMPSSIAGQTWEDLDGDGQKDPGENGLENWTIFIDGNGNGILDPAVTVSLPSSDVPRAIADFSTVSSPLVFDGLSTILDVELTLDITHSFSGDLDIYLISPSGTQVEIATGVGGQLNDFQNTTFDDEAATAIIAGTAPFAGSYRPEGLLSDFDGENPNGVWQLVIRDIDFGDQGILNSWSLAIFGTEQSTVTDANGNYSFTELSPGSYDIYEVLQPGWMQTAPVIPNGQSWWHIDLVSNDQVMEIDFGNKQVELLPGDYDENNVVDAADYTVWRSTLGLSLTPYTGADGNGNGIVDEADRLVWMGNFGRVGSASATAATITESLVTAEDDAATPDGGITAEQFAVHSTTTLPTIGRAGFELRRAEKSVRPTSQAAPVADRADAALVAWLADLSDSMLDRKGRGDKPSFDWDFAENVDSDQPARPLAGVIDSAFAQLGA